MKLRIAGTALIALTLPSAAHALQCGSVLSTTSPAEIAGFQADRTVLDFDEIAVGTSPCFVSLPTNQYASSGIRISAQADGSAETHVARLPQCGSFGPNLSAPNVIGGGVTATGPEWRETIRFDFPTPADAIGAQSDATGSNTSLTAFRADGTPIATVSGDQGNFMGIEAAGIAYALWEWNFDQTVAGFSLDNVTFSIGGQASEVSRVGSPANPDALKPGVTTGPVIGKTWDPAIDHSAFLPGAVLDLLGVAGAPANVPSPFGTILCDVSTPPFVYTAPGAGQPFSVAIPNDCALIGASLCAQGISSNGIGVFVTNALDITIGAD